jgi:hypothetical protein
MSSEKVVRDIGSFVDRRGFLKRTAGAAIAGLFLVLGIPETAIATVTWHCCNLCGSWQFSCSGCACQWCWSCIDGSGARYSCCECYKNTSQCSGCPTSWKCSTGAYLGGGQPHGAPGAAAPAGGAMG